MGLTVPPLPRAGHGRQVMVYNTTRQCIRNYFPTRKCFVFPPPVGAEQQGRPEELPEAALQPGFLLQVERFCQHVLAASRPKELQDGAELNGRSERGGGGGLEGSAAVLGPHRASPGSVRHGGEELPGDHQQRARALPGGDDGGGGGERERGGGGGGAGGVPQGRAGCGAAS